MSDVAKILIVDDERFHLNVMADLLSDNYNVLVAKNGPRALEIASTEPVPDLILLDILMPEMDGYEVCRQLKKNTETQHIPVIFLTVKSDVEDETLGFEQGAVDYITKPFSAPIVKARVNTHLILSKALSDLERQNEFLEQRVSERTQEIVLANEKHEKLQLRLQGTQKLESIGLLAGGIAHDFNNILTAVSGFSQMAYYDLQSGEYEKAEKNLEDISASSERAAALIKQLLEFSRGIPSKPQLLQPNGVVLDTIKLLRPILPTMIKLDVALKDDVSNILFDKVQMHQVLMNLCINARDAMNNSGNLAIAVRQVSILEGECSACHQSVSGEFVVLEVKDSGSGINAEQLEHIFTPFFSTKEIGKGSGMGLSVVNDIVHKHHGHILLKTAPDEGATFQVLFSPASDLEALAARSNRQFHGAGKHILLVSDDASVPMLLKELLDVSGYHVTIYNDSLAALVAITDAPSRFDLVITDQDMPEMTGQALAAAVTAAHVSLPFIICLDDHGEGSEEALYSGTDRVLQKPLQSDVLMKMVGSLLP